VAVATTTFNNWQSTVSFLLNEGISSSCAAGYYLSSGTWVNGVTTGGGCVLAASGGGGTAGTLGFIADNFLNLANGVTKTFTLTYTPSLYSEHVVLDGIVLSGTSDYVLTGNSLALTTAPATACTGAAATNCTSEFNVRYATGATGVNAFILNSTQTVSGATTFTGAVTFSSSTVLPIRISSSTIPRATSLPWATGAAFQSCQSTVTINPSCSGTNLWITGSGSLSAGADSSGYVNVFALVNGAPVTNYGTSGTAMLTRVNGISGDGDHGNSGGFSVIQQITPGTSPSICVGFTAQNEGVQQTVSIYTLTAWCY
jgi:hypothetical protein